MAVSLEYAGKTDVGRVRKSNEDQFLIADLSGIEARGAAYRVYYNL